MDAVQIEQTRTVRAAYGRMMTNGYEHEQAVEMLTAAYRGKVSDAALVRGMWLDPSVPDCDPL